MNTTATSNRRRDLYSRVTERVEADLERGATQSDKVELVASAQGFIAGTGAIIRHGGDGACYSPKLDIIQLPVPETFRDAESYAATTAHELTNWTAHPIRLNRDFGGTRFGDTGYAREELVAELGAAFLCADLGITPEPREDHASYLAHWSAVLKADKTAHPSKLHRPAVRPGGGRRSIVVAPGLRFLPQPAAICTRKGWRLLMERCPWGDS